MRAIERGGLLAVGATLLLAGLAHAGDGRVELGQSAIEADGGFPFQITKPGSYVLTSDLEVPAGTSGIQIAAHEVTLDLNGFGVRGTHSCGSGGCSAGTTIGVGAVAAGSELARNTTLRNGVVSGFGANCVDLGAGASVEGLIVRSCGGSGIRSAEHARVAGNRVNDCGAWGLSFLAAATYAGNLLSNVNRLGGAGFVSGGSTSGGNVCDTGRCPRDRAERKRYYLTPGFYPGNHGANDCALGFHMASLFELYDPSGLEYDATLGVTSVDSGSGPPVGAVSRGWARNGSNSDSCQSVGIPWATSSASGEGMAAWLEPGYSLSAPTGSPSWVTELWACNTSNRIWCVED